MKQKRTVIYLHATYTTQASWITLDETNKVIHSIQQGDLEKLSFAKDHEIYVFIPAQDVLLTSIILPKLSRQRLLQALPYALEEQLIDDVETLHFAIGSYQANKAFSVAIVSHTKIQAWLSLFKTLDLSPCAFIPAIFSLPYTPPNWQVNTFEGHCLVRTGDYSGFACEEENLQTLLELKLGEEPEGSAVQVINSHFSELQLLDQTAHIITTLPAINLLQGAYQAKQQSTQIKKIWLLAGALALTCIFLLFLSNVVSFFILHRHSHQLETEINKIYQRNFPQAKSIVAPRERMTEKLRTLSGVAQKNNFLVLLGKLGKSLANSPAVRIQNLDFREQQLTLEVTSATFDNLDAFTRSLTSQALTVKQQNAAVSGTQVKATLIIRAGA